jgi:hypothetical protein
MENYRNFEFRHACKEWALSHLRFLRENGFEGMLEERNGLWFTYYREMSKDFCQCVGEYCESIVKEFETKMKEIPVCDFAEGMQEVVTRIIDDWKLQAEIFRSKAE